MEKDVKSYKPISINFLSTVVQPKDHVAENVRRMRKIQRETKKKEEETKQPVKALWKSSKYENVQSRVRDINLQVCEDNTPGVFETAYGSTAEILQEWEQVTKTSITELIFWSVCSKHR